MEKEGRFETLKSLPVAVDVMGGDLGLSVVVQGAVRAWRELGIRSILVGKENQITKSLQALKAQSEAGISVCHAQDVVAMEDLPSAAIRGKEDSSIRIAFELVAEGKASSVISPGNTGAMMAAGVFVCGTAPGIARPAIASLLPRMGGLPPVVFLDSGANVDCHAFQLVQFALMGKYYAQMALACESPRVALLSNGSELQKGNDLIRSAAMTLSQNKDIDFVGYVEGRDISRNCADVVVCDGFLGNIVLKAMEGSAELVFDSIKGCIENSIRGKIGIWLATPLLKKLFKEKLDPSSYGGAPLLGLNNVAIVCHGSSNSWAIFNGIRVADKFVREGLIQKLEKSLGSLEVKGPDVFEDGLWERMGKRFERKRNGKSKNRPKKTDESSGSKEEE